MQSKNYYQILGLPSAASAYEVKSAYRKLALLYHPDKNANDKIAENVFKEINEAYGILSDKSKRAAYNKIFFGLEGNTIENEVHVINASIIFQKLINIRSAIAHTDPYRMNTEALYFELNQLFSAFNLSILKKEQNIPTNNQIVAETLLILNFLPLSQQSAIINNFERIDHEHLDNINEFQKRQKGLFFWEKYKVIFVLIATVSICLILYYLIK